MIQELFTLEQIIGVLAFLSYVGAYLFKHDNHLKIGFSLSNILWIWHYFSMGAMTAMLTTCVSIIRNVVSLNSEKLKLKFKIIFAVVFASLLICIGVMTWNGLTSLIAMTATLIFSVAVYFTNKRALRVVMLLTDSLWLVHGIIIASVGGIAYAISALLINLYVIYRDYKPSTVSK